MHTRRYVATFLHGIVAITSGCTSPTTSAHIVLTVSVYSNRQSTCRSKCSYVLSSTHILTLPCRPTWFQAVRLADPVRSGLDFLPMAVTISPAAIAQGLLVAKLGHYRMLVRAASPLPFLQAFRS